MGACVSGLFFSTSQPAVCIVVSLAAWLAGIAAYSAVHDVITGWYISASGRILDVVTSTAGLVTLLMLALTTVGVGSFGAILVASIVAGAVCVILTRELNMASNASLMVVLLPLFPGMLVYQGVLGTIFGMDGVNESLLNATITAFCLSMGAILDQYLASEALWASRRKQFTHKYPDRTFRKEMADEETFSDIMVPIFSKPFTQ